MNKFHGTLTVTWTQEAIGTFYIRGEAEAAYFFVKTHTSSTLELQNRRNKN
jgi:hypothetical protein